MKPWEAEAGQTVNWELKAPSQWNSILGYDCFLILLCLLQHPFSLKTEEHKNRPLGPFWGLKECYLKLYPSPDQSPNVIYPRYISSGS